mmetsp:Transcript_12835/g.32874  ORF Transcript_12835/g.32874 Transcript_12835/m.32874 type:complete len:263 (+) Transcript_12835:228-1016(+)
MRAASSRGDSRGCDAVGLVADTRSPLSTDLRSCARDCATCCSSLDHETDRLWPFRLDLDLSRGWGGVAAAAVAAAPMVQGADIRRDAVVKGMAIGSLGVASNDERCRLSAVLRMVTSSRYFDRMWWYCDSGHLQPARFASLITSSLNRSKSGARYQRWPSSSDETAVVAVLPTIDAAARVTSVRYCITCDTTGSRHSLTGLPEIACRSDAHSCSVDAEIVANDASMMAHSDPRNPTPPPAALNRDKLRYDRSCWVGCEKQEG